MALTKISTDGVKDDAITKAKIPADQIEASELANDAVDTNAIQDDAVTEDKLANSINTAIAANTAKDLTALSASNLTSGTVPDARFPATLPAASAANLTSIPSANLTGALPAISGASLTGLSSGLAMADSWRITANFTGTVTPVSSNWERCDTSPWEGYMGLQMTESSGIFTFPATGWYFVIWSHYFTHNSPSFYNDMFISLSNDSGNSFTEYLSTQGFLPPNPDNDPFYCIATNSNVLDITNISTQKMRFTVRSENNATTQGSSSKKLTGFDIFKLGDT